MCIFFSLALCFIFHFFFTFLYEYILYYSERKYFSTFAHILLTQWCIFWKYTNKDYKKRSFLASEKCTFYILYFTSLQNMLGKDIKCGRRNFMKCEYSSPVLICLPCFCVIKYLLFNIIIWWRFMIHYEFGKIYKACKQIYNSVFSDHLLFLLF